MLNKQFPRSEQQMLKIEQATNHFLANKPARAAEDIITIPVVVHIVYNTSSENLSDAQVQSQIAVLNEDFRRLNADASGNTTSGITRTATSTTSFSTNDYVKYSSNGGKDAWATDKYLNIWVCDLSGGTLGYAQFPGSGAAETDGVVISYRYFGRGGSAQAPFDKGRTASHEVGHWLNLRHIWGDGGCSYDDYVNDTPIAGDAHYGCPSWPTSTCSSYDMYMNYMDYVDDACMNMFSTGQKNRMRALFASGGFRESILSSNGCGGSTTPSYCSSNGKDASYEWIANVKVGSIDYSSGNDGGYIDRTSVSTDLNTGASHSVSLSPGFASSTYDEYWKIWIDYNQDMDFDDAGELVFDAGSLSSGTVSGSFTVPTSATAGTTRMRVSMKYNGAQTACESFNYGEVEDYSVNIVSGSSCETPTNLSTTNITYNSAVCNWSAVSGAQNYTLQYKAASSSTWSSASSTTLSGLSPSTDYNWRVRTNCSSSSSDYSATQTFTTLAEPCDAPTNLSASNITSSSATVSWSSATNSVDYTLAYRVQGGSWSYLTVAGTSRDLTGLTASTTYEYAVKTNCSSTSSSYSSASTFTTTSGTATYCASKGSNSSYEWIAAVNVGNISNSTGNNGGYADFTSIQTDLEQGGAYSISLSPGFSGSTYNEYWKIWIDFNRDGDFSDAGELAFDAGALSSSTVSGTLNVSSSALTGETRMRVSMKYNGAQTACETFSYGEVEDYTVNIVAPAPTYCASKGNNASYEWIDAVTINSINNTSGGNGGYADFTGISTSLALGSSYSITLKPGFSGSTYNEYWKIWIDFNRDGDFTDANELVYDHGSLTSSTVNATMTLPSSAGTGTTRMRVSMKYNGAQSSCESFSYGEVEDYTVNITSSGSRVEEETVSVKAESDMKLSMGIAPNPARDRMSINLEGFESAAIIMMTDLQGRVVYSETVDVYESHASRTLDVSDYAKGSYFIIAREHNNVLREKVLIVK